MSPLFKPLSSNYKSCFVLFVLKKKLCLNNCLSIIVNFLSSLFHFLFLYSIWLKTINCVNNQSQLIKSLRCKLTIDYD